MPNKDKKNRTPDPSESANDNFPVDAALDNSTGGEDRSGRYEGLPEDAMAEEPPYAAGGLGGRSTQRAEDEPWSPTQSAQDMSSPSEPDFGATVLPEADIEADYMEVPEMVTPVVMTPQEMYIETMKANLEERGVDIDALRSQVEGMEPEARSQYLQQLTNLQALRDQASQMLGSLSEAGESAWQTVAEGVDKTYEGLLSALDATMSRFRS